jgi:hypothetical protein
MLQKIMVLGFLLVWLSACSSNTFTFNGETNNWYAVLKVTQQSNGYEEQEFELGYKGDDVRTVGEVNFEVDTNAGGFSGSGYTLNENGVLNSGDEANPTNAKITESSKVEVIVEWNGNAETILLTNN